MTQVSAFRTDAARLTALRRTALLDSPPDDAFDRLTRLAARLLGTPIALVSLVDDERQYFKSAVGLPEPWASRRSTPLAYSFCRHVVESGEPLRVEDARRHQLVRANPAVRELGWIAYLGVPLTLPSGHVVGALSVIDALPRLWSERDLALLRDLGASVVSEIELRARRPGRPAKAPGAAVFEQSALPQGLISVEGHWLRVNRALAELLGTTTHALAGSPAEAVTHHADRSADREALRLLFAGECSSYTGEKRLLRDGHEPRWVLATVTLLPEDDGVPEHLHVAFQDITERRHAEEELRGHEERYRVAADAALDAVRDWDLLTDRVVWRERPGGTFGYRRSAGAATAAWWYERLHPEEREEVVASIQAAIAGGETVWTRRYRFRRANGMWAHVEDRAAIVRDDSGDAIRMVGAMVDVTAGVAAERLARGQRQLLEEVAAGPELGTMLERVAAFVEGHAEGLAAAVLLLDREAGALRLAAGAPPDALRELLASVPLEPAGGVGALAVARREAVEVADVAAEPDAVGWAGRFVAAGIRAAWSIPLLASDGGLLGTIDLYACEPRRPEPDERRLIEIAAHVAEIAIERGRGQEALARTVRLLEQVLEALPVGVWVLDREGRIQFANPAGREIWGGARYLGIEEFGEYRGWWADSGAPIAAEEWAAARAIRKGETSLGEVVSIETFDGLHKTILNSAIPLRALDGAIVGAIMLQEDITERRAAEAALRRSEEQLRHAQKMEAVGQLAGGIAHDFNNLLTGLLSYSDLVLEELHADDPLRADVEQIRIAGQRAAALTRQLLAFSRRQVLQPKVLSLNAVVSEMEAMLRRLIGADVGLETELEQDLWYVLADPGQLEQVLVNLVVNARDAMPRGGVVTITTANRRSDGVEVVTLAVRDTGEGMDLATQARVFEPFFTTKPAGKGTGLGLATVYGIVEQSGGRVDVESAPGQGAVFTLSLPRYAGTGGEVPTVPERRSLPTGTETILLVEDESAVRASARRLLERHGYTVVEARHGADALRIAEAGGTAIDLVITDLVMPEMGGRELVERLRERNPELRVLFMSGYSERAVSTNGRLPPHSAFVEKPFTVEQLTRRTRELLDQR